MVHRAANLSAITLFTDDLTDSKPFYARALEESTAHEDDASAVFRFQSTPINLLNVHHAVALIEPPQTGQRAAHRRVQTTITVADAVCPARGLELLDGPVDRAWGVRTAGFEDPSGHNCEIAQPTSTNRRESCP